MKRIIVILVVIAGVLLVPQTAQAHFPDSTMGYLNQRLYGVCKDHGKWPWYCQRALGGSWTNAQVDAYGIHTIRGYWWSENNLTLDSEKWRATFSFIHGGSISVCCKVKIVD